MSLFRSFVMGGFECADHINRSGVRVNLLRETQHDIRADEDYALLAQAGILTVREGICWSAVETSPGVFDFSEVAHRIAAAQKHGIEQVWDLVHFGYPDGLIPTHPLFCQRFIGLCEAFAQFYDRCAATPLLVVPINEISFLSWHSGEVRGTVPFAVNSGWDIKYHLCKAAIRGIRALRENSPGCKVLLVEPLVMEHGRDDEGFQFQAMDIILGRICPELEGSADLADVLGFNYYWNCQWNDGGPLEWPGDGRKPLSAMLLGAFWRYGKPMLLAETGHFGPLRGQWLKEVMDECLKAIRRGAPLHGICLYPVTDRPDWDDLTSYCQCGIWDLDQNKDRIPHEGFLAQVSSLSKTMQGMVH